MPVAISESTSVRESHSPIFLHWKSWLQVKGSLQVETSLEEGPPIFKTIEPARIRGALVAARELLAADRGGTSDPFAIVDLVDIRTGKALSAPSFTEKTKTIKKTLNPTWDLGINWEGITQKPETLGVKVAVFHAGAF